MVDDAKFEPRLGRIRSTAGGRGKTYLQRVLRAVALSGPSKAGTSAFQGSRIARGFGTGRVLASRDRLSAFRTRRVIVKTRIVKMRGKGGKAAALHLRYIQRDGVTRDGEAGKLYGRDTDCADGKEFLERGLEDRHQFRFIVSAEDASEYPDLKPFVRKLMARMEDDLGTRLDWVAVDHHNTGHPHTHIVLRGRDDLGQDLVIARDYVAHGMRERAAEIVTLDLGPRTDREIEDRLAKQVTQERLTDIDRAMRRMASDAGDLSLTQSRAGAGHHQWAGRLQNLARMGLAEEVAPARWRLSPEMEPSLKAMGERDDIIKLMNRELAVRSMDRGYGELVVHDGEPVTGRVVSRGLCDARDDTHFLLVDGADGRVHYAEVLAEVPSAIAPGAIVRLGVEAKVEREVDRKVAAIAARHSGVYSAHLHRLYDPSASSDYIAAHVRRLEAMRRVAGLVDRKADGSWSIPKDHAARGREFDQNRAGARVELLSSIAIDALPKAMARTWLDQELFAEAPVPLATGGFGADVRQALRQRREWLVEQGLAKSEGGRTAYRRDLLDHLKDRELAGAGDALAGRIGKPYAVAATVGTVEGVHREAVQLVSGKFAVIERARDFTLVPWRPVLEQHVGKPVHGVMRGDGVSWSVNRARGPSIS